MAFSAPKGPASPDVIRWGKKKDDGVYGSRKVQREMGVSAHTSSVEFFLPNKHLHLVWEVTKKWHHFSRSSSGIYSHRIVSLINHAVQFGTKIDGPDKKEDITDIWYKGTSAHLQETQREFFQKIAKYVKAGSYINWEGGEPWEYWQWYFNGDCMIEKTGRVVYE